jgi:hypothetical protein
MHTTPLTSAVEELLIRDQFAGIPGFGGIMLKSVGSNVNHYTFELKPTHSQLIFNAQLDQNDGQLAHLLSLKMGTSYKEALIYIEETIGDLKLKLKQKKYATFYPFGNFFLNDQGGIFFVGRQQYNLHLSNYGLQPLKWDKPNSIQKGNSNPSRMSARKDATTTTTLSDFKTEEAQVVSLSEETVSNYQVSHRSNNWFNIAAGFVLISVSALALAISTMTWVGIYRNPSQYASMNILWNRSEISPENNSITTQQEAISSKELPHYILIDGKLVKMNSEISQDENASTNHGKGDKISDEIDLLNSDYFKEYIFNKKGAFFLVGGSYITEKAAEMERKQWIHEGIPAFIFKPANSNFYRIVLGRSLQKEELQEYSVDFKIPPGVTLSLNRWTLK